MYLHTLRKTYTHQNNALTMQTHYIKKQRGESLGFCISISYERK